ncbi:MAG: 30S ribosomal protein S21 [Candidatus Paceibacterota bacterium]|jgi:ribosomal protein S21
MSVSVKVKYTEHGDPRIALDNALKKLKNKIKKSNMLIELKRSEYFMKPSARKRAKRISAISRNEKRVAEEKQREKSR